MMPHEPGDDSSSVSSAVLVVVIGMVSAMHIGKLPVAIPVLRAELGLSLVEAGYLLSLVQVAGMLGGLTVGLLADKAGPRRVMLVGLAVLTLSSLLGSMSQGVAQLLWTRGAEGAGFLLSVLPAPALLRLTVRNSMALSKALGWWGAYMPVGTATAMLVGGMLIGSVGWRGLWLLLSALTGGCALLLWARVPGTHGIAPSSAFVPRLLRTLRASGPWYAALAFFCYSGQWLAVVGFLPTIYSGATLPVSVVGWLSALAAGINMTGNIAAGRLLARGVAPVRLLLTGYVAMGLGALLTFGVPESPLLGYLGVLVFSAFGGLIPGTLFSLAVSLSPGSDTISTTVGWMQQWSSLGQFLGPPVVAMVAVWVGGWSMTWMATGACSVIGVALAWRLQGLWRQLARPLH
ncbi:CynX/NimT family MFS transporter [Hydrogenophaga sp.]|uniref:MFS transporter n=1 Tax=Hydrogenophaga sp. TaxID=1904254 RepID=UPI0035B2B34A